MVSNIIIWSTAAFGGTPFRLKKCTALGSAGTGAAAGSAVGYFSWGPSLTPQGTIRGNLRTCIFLHAQ